MQSSQKVFSRFGWLASLAILSFLALEGCRLTAGSDSTAATVTTAAVAETSTSASGPAPRIASSSAQGGDVSGGGSGRESEFKNQLNALIARMQKVGFFILPIKDENKYFSVGDLAESLKITKVSFVERTLTKLLDGVEKEVDALNYPASHLIEVHSEHWDKLDSAARDKLVLHEIYGLMEIEKDVYDNSNETLDTLHRLEKPVDPRDQCPVEAHGAHDGDACLQAIIYVVDDGILAAEETLLAFSESPAADSRDQTSSKEKIKTYVTALKSTYEAHLDETCQNSSLEEGNYAAYGASLCELKFARQRLDLLTQFFNKVKASFPEIPYPRKAEAWNG